ncbi:MAG: hypothetical protein HC850_07110 [Rhodomicrobium sp.]|nr:hypothetical protein [Rhodomicrobium sp.]
MPEQILRRFDDIAARDISAFVDCLQMQKALWGRVRRLRAHARNIKANAPTKLTDFLNQKASIDSQNRSSPIQQKSVNRDG